MFTKNMKWSERNLNLPENLYFEEHQKKQSARFCIGHQEAFKCYDKGNWRPETLLKNWNPVLLVKLSGLASALEEQHQLKEEEEKAASLKQSESATNCYQHVEKNQMPKKQWNISLDCWHQTPSDAAMKKKNTWNK